MNQSASFFSSTAGKRLNVETCELDVKLRPVQSELVGLGVGGGVGGGGGGVGGRRVGGFNRQAPQKWPDGC